MAGMWRVVPVAVAASALIAAGAAQATPLPERPPGAPDYIDHTEWVYKGDRATLKIYPTFWGWGSSGVLVDGPQSYDAWAELLEHAPDANTLSMQAQFFCYWQMSSFTNPGKVGTWNLEPWRPVVLNTMVLNAGCNPGGPEDFISWEG